MKNCIIFPFSPHVKKNSIDRLSTCFNENEINVVSSKWIFSKDSLFKEIKTYKEKNILFDYIVFCAHGESTNGIGGIGSPYTDYFTLSWEEFSWILDSICLKDNSVLILFCCQGAVEKTVYTIFEHSNKKIKYLFGSTTNISSDAIAQASCTFIKAMEDERNTFFNEKDKVEIADSYFCYNRDLFEFQPKDTGISFGMFSDEDNI